MGLPPKLDSARGEQNNSKEKRDLELNNTNDKNDGKDKKEKEQKNNHPTSYTLRNLSRSIFKSSTATVSGADWEKVMTPPLQYKVFRKYVKRVSQYNFTKDCSRVAVIWKIVRKDLVVSYYDLHEIEKKIQLNSLKKLPKDEAQSQEALKRENLLKRVYEKCKNHKEIERKETTVYNWKHAIDEMWKVEEHTKVLNLQSKEEITQVFQHGFTMHDSKTLNKLFDFSKDGLSKR